MKIMKESFVDAKNSLSVASRSTGQSHTAEQWRRWDEELVSTFTLWITRLGKSAVIATGVLLGGLFVGLFS
jgi:hypothetical protein